LKKQVIRNREITLGKPVLCDTEKAVVFFSRIFFNVSEILFRYHDHSHLQRNKISLSLLPSSV
jgi:hypothetical protein